MREKNGERESEEKVYKKREKVCKGEKEKLKARRKFWLMDG